MDEMHISFFNRHNSLIDQFRPHRHSCYELICFLSGRGSMVLNEKAMAFKPGDCCLVPPACEHTELYDGAGEIAFIGFEWANCPFELPVGLHTGSRCDYAGRMLEITDECIGQKPEYEWMIRAKLCEMLISIYRELSPDRPKERSIRYAVEYLREHASQKLDVAALAKMSGYSYDRFRHLFEQFTGLSVRQYVQKLRLESACRLLAQSERSVTDIAYHCGYADGAQFSRLFKTVMGESPSSFRLKNKIAEKYK